MPDKLIGAAAAAKRYFGKRATGYEARRAGRPHWAKENAAVESMLSDLPRCSSVLDVPVGTGRYVEIYKRAGFFAAGLDASGDMLDVARENARKIGYPFPLHLGDALNLPYHDLSFHAVVCTRLVNWFLPDEMACAVREAMRVADHRVIISVELGPRTADGGNNPHEPAVWAAALKSAGAVERQRVEIEPGYFMIELRRR